MTESTHAAPTGVVTRTTRDLTEAAIAGATTMLAEYAPPTRRGLIASFVALGTNSGTLAASALWALLLGVLSDDQLLSWGWRLPFLLSSS